MPGEPEAGRQEAPGAGTLRSEQKLRRYMQTRPPGRILSLQYFYINLQSC
jgi:hypothetical protein